MKSLAIILVGLAISWHYTDIHSASVLYSVLCPFDVFIFLVSSLLWLIIYAGFGKKTDAGGAFIGSDIFDSDLGGGDGH